MMKLTNNFYLHEFACKDGSQTPLNVYYNLQKLAIQLQVLRNYLEAPISINSGYRSEYYNDVVLPSKGYNTSKNSQHKLGNAADIVVKGFKPSIVAYHIEKLIDKGEMLQGGIGIYNGFVHYDIGYNGKRRRWDKRN